ncbi:hypothetical protein BH11CYA1_BH11CYA1_33670 [soil metagenome]
MCTDDIGKFEKRNHKRCTSDIGKFLGRPNQATKCSEDFGAANRKFLCRPDFLGTIFALLSTKATMAIRWTRRQSQKLNLSITG